MMYAFVPWKCLAIRILLKTCKAYAMGTAPLMP